MVYGGKHVFGTVRGSETGGRSAPLLALLILLALLVCHGALAGAHPSAPGPTEPGQTQPFPEGSGLIDPPIGEHALEYVPPGAAYALAVLVALLASIVGWTLGRARERAGAGPSMARRCVPAAVLGCIRPPTVHLLLVFRL